MIPLWTALTLGFLGSLHCLGMCGPLVMSVPMASGKSGGTALNVMSYHGSRILAYSFLGVLPGLVGAGLQVTATQQWISIIVGIAFLIGCVLSLKGRLKFKLKFIDNMTQSVQNLFYTYIKGDSRGHLLAMGFLNGLIPCGMVYMAMAAALGSGSVINSMTYMMAFGLGTTPIFILLAIVQTQKLLNIRPYLIKLIPVSLGVLGLIFLWRGICVSVPMDLSVLKEMGWQVMCH